MESSKANMSTTKTRRTRCSKYSSILGCGLLLVPNGLFWFWGNITVYCMSYFVSVLDEPTGVEDSWIYSLFIICWTVAAMVSGALANRIGRRSTILIGILVFDAGIFCSFFSMQHSLAALTVTMGVMTGVGTGFMDSSSLHVAIGWSDDEVGRITSLIHGSLSLGGVMINQIVTRYVNPENVVPTYKLGPSEYFIQRDLLDKIPSMFLVMGAFSLSVHLIAFAMIREKNKAKGIGCDGDDDRKLSEVSSLSDQYKKEKIIPGRENATDNNNLATTGEDTTVKSLVKDEECDYSYRQMLRCKSFYAIWIAFFINSLPLLLISSYFKLFGQVWIKDDHFMSDLGTTMSVGSTVTSTLSGFVVDAFGVKNCIGMFTSSLVLVLFWYYFTVMVGRWMFFVVSLVFFCLGGPIYCSFSSATAIYFGKTNFSTNYGVMMTAQMCFHLISPFVVGRVLANLGWYVTFVGTGMVVMLSLIPITFFVPNK